ncbi:MAG: YifB family Mg chelatase-like AAA ATPase [Alphaproteobacteria bacterium]|nr:YifB family Mg chelatase-like AAA ATPase [Alphaproteobacteria bacterium]
MIARVGTVAFEGIDVKPAWVEAKLTSGTVAFTIVGLPDKAVAESRERVRAALHSMGLSLPAKRLTVNLAPADLAKEGSHYDLPIALAVLGAMEILPHEDLANIVALGELGLDSSIRPVAGVLPAALHASTNDNSLVCPASCGSEAVWAGDVEILAPKTLMQLINHLKGTQMLSRPEPPALDEADEKTRIHGPDLAEVKGQETAKRALEIAAAGGHNLLMIGPPGAGKSMLASCLPGILPPLSPAEALEISMIHSLAGTLPDGGLMKERPYRDPHHSASLPALVGGGHRVKPGEISLAHNGILFLDELPEFARATLESLRQPLETGKALIARANAHVSFPARFQLIAAMNPCRCGHLGDPALECTKAPRCGGEYQAKLSGPLLDRIDMQIEVQPVGITDLGIAGTGEPSSAVRARVTRAREIQARRFQSLSLEGPALNAYLKGDALEKLIPLTDDARTLLNKMAESARLSARGYFRVLKLARTIADLADLNAPLGPEKIGKHHIAEAFSYRRSLSA